MYRYLLRLIAALACLAPLQLPAQTCNGLTATLVGTAADDELAGTPGDDVIVGLAGDDRIAGGGGDDTICGGDGDDDLLGEAGSDRLFGEAGDDVLIGDDATSVGLGTAGDDSCDGGPGADAADLLCDSGAGNDVTIVRVRLRAHDGLPLDGALYLPTGEAAPQGARDLAVLVSHGAMGSFEFSVPKAWGLWGAQRGFTVLALNRRDAGPDSGGGAVLFEDATLDLQAGIDLLQALGYPAVFVAGHSQGTQNAAIYPSFSGDERVAAVGLYGVVDDGRSTARDLLFWEVVLGPDNGYSGLVALNEQLIAAGQGDVLRQYDTIFGVPLTRTPKNWMSYWGPDTLSVVVREITRLTALPVLLLRADGDEFTPDAMSQNVLTAALDAGVDATYIVLPYVDREGNAIPLSDNGGNAHSLVGVERRAIAETITWLESRVALANRFTAGPRAPVDAGGGNFAPLVPTDLGTPLQVPAGKTFRLDGWRAQDVDGTLVGWSWVQLSGDAVVLSDPAAPQPFFNAPARAGTLVFELTVTDDAGATGSGRLTVTVLPGPAPADPQVAALPGGSSALGPAGLLAMILACLPSRRRRVIIARASRHPSTNGDH